MSSFDERLRLALDVRGLSQHALARSIGLTSGEMSRLARGERGSRVSYVLVAKIARGLGVSIAWLGEGDGPAPRRGDSAPDALPKRQRAIELWREADREAHAIDRVMNEPLTDAATHMSVIDWIEHLQYAAKLPPLTAPISPPVARSHARPRADTLPPTRRSSPHKK